MTHNLLNRLPAMHLLSATLRIIQRHFGRHRLHLDLELDHIDLHLRFVVDAETTREQLPKLNRAKRRRQIEQLGDLGQISQRLGMGRERLVALQRQNRR